MVPLSFDGENLRVRVPDQGHVRYIEQNYISMLRPIIREEFGVKTRLHYAIPTAHPKGQQGGGNSSNASLYSQTDTSTIKNPFIIPGIKRETVDPQLNPELTFENHIEGDCNRLARAWRRGRLRSTRSLSTGGRVSGRPISHRRSDGPSRNGIRSARCFMSAQTGSRASSRPRLGEGNSTTSSSSTR